MVFDSWGGVLADGAFQNFSLAYIKRMLDQLIRSHEGQTIPRLVFTKGGGLWLQEMNVLDCEFLGLDWSVKWAKRSRAIGPKPVISRA
jgi:uroporphyrinogen decarboxylase